MTDLEKKFDHWAKAIGLYECHEQQRVMMKMAFYSGVLVGKNTMMIATKHENEDTCIAKLEFFLEELELKLEECGNEMEALDQ